MLGQTSPEGWKDGLNAMTIKMRQEVIHVTALVREQALWFSVAEQSQSLGAVVSLPTRKQEVNRSAKIVGEQVNLRR